MLKTKRKIKVIFVLPSLEGGGAERVTSLLLQYLDRRKFDLILLLVNKIGQFVTTVPQDVLVIDLGKHRLREALLPITRIIRSIRPDLVFSTIGSLNLLIAFVKHLIPDKIKFVVRESNLVSMKNKSSKYPVLYEFLYRTIYRKVDAIICQSKDMEYDLWKYYRISKNKLYLINNPVPVSYIEKRARENRTCLNPAKFNLIAVGSLTWKKGFDRLLKAIALLKKESIHLTILGEGEEERSLKELASKLNLRDKVSFLGFKTNPYPFMAQADLLVITSRHEGFPNVLLEANACGTPVLAMRCPGGINEIIIEDVNGWTMKNGDIQTFAKKIEAALYKVWDKNSIRMSVKKRYDVSIIVPQYEAMLMTLAMR